MISGHCTSELICRESCRPISLHSCARMTVATKPDEDTRIVKRDNWKRRMEMGTIQRMEMGTAQRVIVLYSVCKTRVKRFLAHFSHIAQDKN